MLYIIILCAFTGIQSQCVLIGCRLRYMANNLRTSPMWGGESISVWLMYAGIEFCNLILVGVFFQI